MAMTDLELIEQFRKGSERAFNELVNRYKNQVFSIIYRMVHNKEDALDLAQDTFVRAYRHIDGFKGQSGFFTWLYRIAVNLSVNDIHRNKTKNWQSIEDAPAAATMMFENPTRHLEHKQLNQSLKAAISQLPDKQRAIFILRFYENLSHKEIAAIVERSEGAVKANYFHAINKLKEALADFKE